MISNILGSIIPQLIIKQPSFINYIGLIAIIPNIWRVVESPNWSSTDRGGSPPPSPHREGAHVAPVIRRGIRSWGIFFLGKGWCQSRILWHYIYIYIILYIHICILQESHDIMRAFLAEAKRYEVCATPWRTLCRSPKQQSGHSENSV